MTEESLTAIGGFIQVPTPFQKRLSEMGNGDLLANLFNELLHRTPSTVHARIGESGIVTVRSPNAKAIEPQRIIDIASSVMSPRSLVLDFENTPDSFGLDVIIPDNFDRGVGGDLKVGDISRAGLRFGQNVKNNLAPKVDPLIYRLICTNGMEIPDETLRVESRGNTVDEVLQELEFAARRAFERVERDMEHFYAMRDERVEHPERVIARIAQEHGLSDRLRIALIDAVPSMELAAGEDGEASMFDLVNLITNMANNPAVTRQGTRRSLQSLGGTISSQHTERCRSCASKLTR